MFLAGKDANYLALGADDPPHARWRCDSVASSLLPWCHPCPKDDVEDFKFVSKNSGFIEEAIVSEACTGKRTQFRQAVEL